MAVVTAAGGAGEEPFESLVVERGAIRAIPYSIIEHAEKEGGYFEKEGGVSSAKWILVRGRQMVYKAGPPGNVVNEYISYQLLGVLGARVPASYLVINVPAGNIPMAVMTEYLPGAITAKKFYESMGVGKRTELRLAIQSEFLYHALLINWDAKNWENHMVVPLSKGADGEVTYDIHHPYSIDPGGALFYRAMGDPKRKSDLLPFEIPEFTRMPAMSPKTQGKFYTELVDPRALHANVCRRAATIDDAAVMATVESLRPLFGFLPKDADLPTLIKFRLAFLRIFCTEAVAPSRINIFAAQGEHLGLNGPLPEGVVEPFEQTIARIRYGAKVASLAEEAKEGVRMRGKREVLEPTENLINENFNNFQVHNLPVIRERRHAGVNKYGFEYNSNSNSENNYNNDNENWEPPGLYPVHRYTIKPPASEKVRQSVLAAQEDPEIDAWLREQVAFIHELSWREQDILKSYTRNGDVLVNNYLRGTLYDDSRDLVEASLRVSHYGDDRPVALGYSVLDQLSSIVKRKDIVVYAGLEKKDDFITTTTGHLNMFAMRDFMMANLDYFGQAIHLGPLIEQYQRELTAILEKAPRPPHAFWVYRGLKSESHLTSLTFRNVDFLSTSMSPEWAAALFTRAINDERALVSRKYRCCMYELKVRPDVPCLYMQSLSQYPDEYEMLIAPGMTVSLEPTARLKSIIEREGTTLTIEALKAQLRKHASKIAVVEGTIQKAKPVATRKGGIQVEEKGSFEKMATKMVHTRKNTRKAAKRDAAVEERFVTQKPRGELKGRNRTRRVNVNWKLNRNKSKRRQRNNLAANYSNTAWSKPSNST
jgi:hypothetical protein